jgi:hypothetical protein
MKDRRDFKSRKLGRETRRGKGRGRRGARRAMSVTFSYSRNHRRANGCQYPRSITASMGSSPRMSRVGVLRAVHALETRSWCDPSRSDS